MEWSTFKDWWRLKVWKRNKTGSSTGTEDICFCDDCFEVRLERIPFLETLFFDVLSISAKRLYTKMTGN